MPPTVPALFTKPPVGVLSGWNHPQGPFQPPAPFTAYGSFRNCTRQNHGMAGNCEAGGFVNSTVLVPSFVSPQLANVQTYSNEPNCTLPLTGTSKSCPRYLRSSCCMKVVPNSLVVTLGVLPFLCSFD